MSDHTPSDSQALQRRIAGECNTEAWDLIKKPDLDPVDIAQLITLAATALHHWHAIGTPDTVAHAGLLFACAQARAGVSGATSLLARETLAYFEDTGAGWERAFAHAAMAAACDTDRDADRDADGFARHYAEAGALGAELSGEDARYFQAAFKTLPEPSLAAP